MPHFDVLIVGAGHGGAHAAIGLRQLGFEGSMAMLEAGADWPYERPPLSKEYLAGSKPFAALLLKEPDSWRQKDVTVLLGLEVVAVEPAAHVVRTASGAAMGYTTLIWAGGGAARRLTCPGAHLAGVHTIRTRADVDALKEELPTVASVVVVGGGYIGLETASVLVKLGKSVTVVERENRVLARVAGEAISRFYEAEHRAHGVRLLLEAAVTGLQERDGRVCGVRLEDGTMLPADMVVVGIGLIASVGPLLAAGASCSNGVEVDAFARTSLPDVYAIGDCAAHASRYAEGRRIRIESVQNAVDQALVVAKTIMGRPVAYDAVPWFWSNQFDLRLQTVGLSGGHDTAIVRGDPAARSFSVVYLRRSAVIALDCVNATRDYVQGRALVANGSIVDPERLADSGQALRRSEASRFAT